MLKHKLKFNLKKKALSGLAGIILLSGCSTIQPSSIRPFGTMGVSYVPERYEPDRTIEEIVEPSEEIIIDNELKFSGNLGLEILFPSMISNNINLHLGVKQELYFGNRVDRTELKPYFSLNVPLAENAYLNFYFMQTYGFPSNIRGSRQWMEIVDEVPQFHEDIFGENRPKYSQSEFGIELGF